MATNEQLLKQNLIFNEFINNADFTASFDEYSKDYSYKNRTIQMGSYGVSKYQSGILSANLSGVVLHFKILASSTNSSSDGWAVKLYNSINQYIGVKTIGGIATKYDFYALWSDGDSDSGVINWNTFQSSLTDIRSVTVFFNSANQYTVKAYLDSTLISSLSTGTDMNPIVPFYIESIDIGENSGAFNDYLYDISVFDINILNYLSEKTIVDLLNNNKFYYGQYKFCYELSAENVIKRRKTRDEIINEALRICGRVRSGDTPFYDDVEIAINSLDAALTDLIFYGFRAWQVEEVSRDLFASDVIDVNGTAYTCRKGHVASQVNKPGSGALWKKYWVAGGTTTGDWKHGTTYRTINELKLDGDTIDVMKVYLTDTNGNDTKIDIIGMEDYYNIEDKVEGGTPKYCYIDYSYEEPVLYLDYATSAVYDTINYLRIKGVNGLLEATDNVEIDPQWRKIVVYKLATYLADEFDLPLQKRQFLAGQFERIVMLGRKGDSIGIQSRITKGAY